MAELSEELASALIALFGARGQMRGAQAVESAARTLVDSERFRRGEPDASGAQHVLALTQGPLLRREYDLSTHGHYDEGWEIGAVVVDPRALILVNQEHGFETGDRVLREIVGALRSTFPSGLVVRIHSDAFAVLLPPSAEVEIDAGFEERTRRALEQGVSAAPLEHTISLLHLTIARPSHWQVLGPLVWAECERAHTLARSGQASGVQRRRIELDAAVPIATF